MKPFRMKNYLFAQFKKDKQGHTTFHRYCVAVFNDYLSMCQAAFVTPQYSTIESFLGQEVDKNGGRVERCNTIVGLVGEASQPCEFCDVAHSQKEGVVSPQKVSVQ